VVRRQRSAKTRGDGPDKWKSTNHDLAVSEIGDWVCTMNSDTASADHGSTPERHSSAADATPHRTLNSADLFQGAREVQIRHDEKIYRLQVTRNGKLILIK
jgi:hemin uptake protein HemP